MVKEWVKRCSLRILLILQIGLFGTSELSSQSLSNYNLSHLYQIEDSTFIKNQVIGNGTDAFVFLSIPLSTEVLQNNSYAYFLSRDMKKDPDVYVKLEDLNRYRQITNQDQNVFGLRAKNNQINYFIFAVVDSTASNTLFYPIFLPTSLKKASADVLIYGEERSGILINNYIRTGESVKLNSLLTRSSSYRIEYFADVFNAARPPMSPPPENPPPAPISDSTFTVKTLEPFLIETEGLYLIHQDSAEAPLSKRAVDPAFPRPNSIEDLVEPLRYLTTDEEYSKIMSSENKKAEFDEFWILNTQSEERARKMIRGYFKRIREANELFTNYKKGWKTDKGMVYTILGPPSKVYFENNREMWVYSKSFELSTISFTFVKIDTPFSDDHYILERRAEYTDTWFKAIELWRKGRKTL